MKKEKETERENSSASSLTIFFGFLVKIFEKLDPIAMAPRFLFADGDDPHMNSTSSSSLPKCLPTNCPGFCFNDACIIFPSPLPPPPPPSSSSDPFPIDVRHKSRLLSTFLISAASFLAFSFILLLLFYALLRLHRRRRRRRQQQPHQQPPPPPLDLDSDDDLLLDDDNTPHPVWYIRTVGLDDAVIKAIAAAVYKAGDGLVDGGDCTVCLGEFVDGEVVKILPKCSHAFHLSCIDTWLRSHVNCPLCRAPVVAPPAAAVVDGDSGPSENTHIEIPPNQEEGCAVVVDLEAGSSSSGPLGNSTGGENEVQPIRRSVSMDSTSLGMLMLRAEFEPEEKLGEEKKEVELQRAVALKSKGKGVDSLGKHPGVVEMKRSLSSRSGRMFFSRCRRGRSTSVLPL